MNKYFFNFPADDIVCTWEEIVPFPDAPSGLSTLGEIQRAMNGEPAAIIGIDTDVVLATVRVLYIRRCHPDWLADKRATLRSVRQMPRADSYLPELTVTPLDNLVC